MTAKQRVLSYDAKASIIRTESAFYRGIEFRVTWGRDGKGNSKRAMGKSPSEAWVKAINLIEKTK